jgi:hypothetical protein
MEKGKSQPGLTPEKPVDMAPGDYSIVIRTIRGLDGEDAVNFRNSFPENITAIIQRSCCPEGAGDQIKP